MKVLIQSDFYFLSLTPKAKWKAAHRARRILKRMQAGTYKPYLIIGDYTL